MTARLSVILAVAWRDLAQQLRGRRGWLLPVIAALLLVPLAAIPNQLGATEDEYIYFASGDVPAQVAAHHQVRVVEKGGLVFEQTAEALLVHGPYLPDVVREALDADQAEITVKPAPAKDFPLPGRTLLLTLVASSILTGAVSESIAGERGRKTMEALLCAAVTRSEIVLGKWLAWGGFGALAAGGSALVAIAIGRVELGYWALALPTVPFGTVALGMYLTRRARDVVGGATVSLRVLPAVLSVLGITAWFLGLASPELGAAVPLGGALVSAGSTWDGPWPPIIAAVSTLAFTLALLWGTARDLERAAPAGSSESTWFAASLAIVWSALLWFAAIAGPILWSIAGNDTLANELPIAPGLVAASLGVLALLGVRAASSQLPAWSLGLTSPPPIAWVGVLLAATLALLPPTSTFLWPDPPTAIVDLATRMYPGMNPFREGIAVGLLTVVAQELLFRGYLQRTLGPIAATIAWVAIICPTDPLSGLAMGSALAAITYVARGSVLPAMAARLLMGVTLFVALPSFVGTGIAAVGLLFALAWAGWQASRAK